jgi:hypothetical protein
LICFHLSEPGGTAVGRGARSITRSHRRWPGSNLTVRARVARAASRPRVPLAYPRLPGANCCGPASVSGCHGRHQTRQNSAWLRPEDFCAGRSRIAAGRATFREFATRSRPPDSNGNGLGALRAVSIGISGVTIAIWSGRIAIMSVRIAIAPVGIAIGAVRFVLSLVRASFRDARPSSQQTGSFSSLAGSHSSLSGLRFGPAGSRLPRPGRTCR